MAGEMAGLARSGAQLSPARAAGCLSDSAPPLSCRTRIQVGPACDPSRSRPLPCRAALTPQPKRASGAPSSPAALGRAGPQSASATLPEALVREAQKERRRCWKASAAPRTAGQPSDLYLELGVESTATKADIKKAYRQKALQYHPDVNSGDDASELFIRLSRAYEVLSDDKQRAAYDQFGLAGLDASWADQGAGAASWEAFDTWEEFQPYTRRTRRGDARNAAVSRGRAAGEDGGSQSGSDASDEEGSGPIPGSFPGEAQLGDVVEYPLSAAVKDRLNDGRVKGVGFVVGRNKDRGDWKKLPPENVGLVEIEPLCYEADAGCWKADTLESSAFPRLEELRVLKSEFIRKSDSWIILDELSEGCGSPIYEEEIIL